MAKNIIKEIIIILLLCLAIILVLGVLLYEYVPSNKIIPEKVSYTTPENVKEELNKTDGVDEEEIIMEYKVEASDLNNYKKVSDYVPGKPNPFSSYNTETTNGQNNSSGTTGNNSNSSNAGSSNASNGNQSSAGTYIPNKGTK